MSNLQVMLGEPVASIKTGDGRAFKLHPLRLSDVSKLQARLGPMVTWNTPEMLEKLKDLDVVCFMLWLSIRRNPEAKEMQPEEVADLFEIGDIPRLKDALEQVMITSGLAAKNLSGAAGADPAAPSPGPASGSTA